MNKTADRNWSKSAAGGWRNGKRAPHHHGGIACLYYADAGEDEQYKSVRFAQETLIGG